MFEDVHSSMAGGDQVPAGPQHPLSPDGTPAPGAGPVVPEEDQDQVLAWEMAAFPADDEPAWDELEYLEYFGDGEPGEQPQPADLPGTLPRATPAAATPGDGNTDDRADPRADRRGIAAGAGFAQGGAADVMPPGPMLADLADRAWQDGLGNLDDDELTGVLQAWQRLGARAAAGLFAAASELAARREAEGQATRDWRMLEHAVDEVALALTLTGYSAGRVLGLALALDRLPLTRAALAAGRIDERRAALIADELTGLDDEDAAAVEASVIGNAPGLTTGELRPVLRRAVIAVDPAAAKRRKEEALKDARVEASSEQSGTARLAGRDLPPAEVLAADKNLTALAMDMKKAGIPGTLDQLRARAYLHLLSGHPADTLFTTGGSGTGGGGTSSGGTRGGGSGGDGASGAPTTSPTGTTGDSTPGTGAASTATPGRGSRALRGSVNLTMPLATWLGWSQSPGQVPGFGTMDADDSRTLAARLAADPGNQWCITLTDPAGQAVAHGCSTTGPGPYDEPDPGPEPRAGPGPAP